MTRIDRREFLKLTGAGTGALLTGCATAPGFLGSGRASANVVVIGAGAFGGWTALNLQRAGARVTLVDMFGPGNSRATSGDETRGVRTSYGDRPHGELWMQWANRAIQKWKDWDAEYARPLRMQLFFTTGDVILRDGWQPFLTQTRAWWQKNGIPHEVLTVDEVRKRWPHMSVDDVQAVLYEPNAGVVRARRSCEAVAEVFRLEGGRIVIARAAPPEPGSYDGSSIMLSNGDRIGADAFVFATGPWLGKTFKLMENRIRTPLGAVFYYGTPPGDERFLFPNMPSWNYPGTTGWPGLPVDNRGFRVRGGGGGGGGRRVSANSAARDSSAAPSNENEAPQPERPVAVTDPDASSRWIDADRVVRSRQWVGEHFPALRDMPLLATHACHYEGTSSRNFIIDRHPGMQNVWIAGGGNAEGFKQGPVLGEYIASRVLGGEGDPEVAKAFRIPENEFGATQRRNGENDEGEREGW